MFRRFDRYVLQEIFPPFLLGLLVYSFVLLMNQVFLFAELLISRRVEFGVAGELLVDLIPAILAFTIPMAVATGGLAAMSRLSSDWEILAMKTLGISLPRLARPVFLFAFFGWLVSSALTLYIAPYFNDRWVNLLTQSVLSRAQFQIAPREFNETIPHTMLFIQDVGLDNSWSKIFVYRTSPDQLKVILSRRGRLHVFPEIKRAVLELEAGEIHVIPPQEPERHSVAAFERHEEEVDVAALFPEFSRQKRVREKNILELWQDARQLRATLSSPPPMTETKTAQGKKAPSISSAAANLLLERERQIRAWRSHQVEVHKRFSLPFVCFLFAFIAVPLGISTRRGGRTSGFTLSLVIILIYYILITGGEKASVEGRLAPWLGMWGPNLVFFALSLFLFWREAKEEKFRLSWGPLAAKMAAKWRVFRRRRAEAAGLAASTSESRRRLFFPALLDRYLLRRFIYIFLLVFLALLLVSVLVTIFERLDNIYEHNKPFLWLLEYVAYRLPEFLLFILPLATLMTTLLTLGLMEKTNEITAVKASGISLYRIILPILIPAIFICSLSFYVQEYVTPFANRKAEELWNRINDSPPRTFSVLDRRWVLSQDGRTIYHFSYFDPIAEIFNQLSLFRLDVESWRLKEVTRAEKGRLKDGELTLLNGWRREFPAEKASSFYKFKEMSRLSAEKAAYFVQEWKEPAWMNYRELKNYIQEVAGMGFPVQRLRVELDSKLSFPLVSLIMVLLGVPFAFTMGRRGALVGVGLSIVLAIIYWTAIGFMKSLGYVGALPSFLGAWGPVLLFGSLGLFLISRLRS